METDLKAQIDAAEAELQAQIEVLSKLRKQVPPEPVKDYAFQTPSGEVHLSDLFGEKSDLIIVHNMGRACTYCTLWADGFNGFAPHLEDRAGFVLTSPDAPEDQVKFAESRGWKFKMVSNQGNTFAKDMGFEPEAGNYWPAISTFVKDDAGNIFRAGSATLGPGDLYCSIWHIFDLLPASANGWEPKYRYNQG